MRTFALIILAGAFSVPAFAQSFTVDQLSEAGRLASNQWMGSSSSNNDKYVGFKVWRSGSEGKVKVYYKEGDQSLNVSYLCHIHDDEIECHQQ